MKRCSKECACEDAVPAASLYNAIEIDKVVGINEERRGQCSEVIKKGVSGRSFDVCAHAKTGQGLVVKIPFLYKVSLSSIEIRTSFKQIEVVANNRYVTLTSVSRSSDRYFLSGTDHIIRVSLPSYKYKTIDFLTLRLKESAEKGTLSYLCICGEVVGSLPQAVNVSYELYSAPKKTKMHEKETTSILK